MFLSTRHPTSRSPLACNRPCLLIATSLSTCVVSALPNSSLALLLKIILPVPSVVVLQLQVIPRCLVQLLDHHNIHSLVTHASALAHHYRHHCSIKFVGHALLDHHHHHRYNILDSALDHGHQCNNIFDHALDHHHHHCILKLQSRMHIMMITMIKS